MTEPAATPAVQPDERKPWHAPTLTEVALSLTSVGSGPTNDGDGSSTSPD